MDWTREQKAMYQASRQRIHPDVIHASGGKGRNRHRVHRRNEMTCGAWSEGLKDLPREVAPKKELTTHTHVATPERVTKRCKTPAEFKAGKKPRRLPVKQEILLIR